MMHRKWMAFIGAMIFALSAVAGGATYMVVDVSGGMAETKWPVSYMDEVPKGGWTDEYKTDKIVLRKVMSGSFLRRKSIETFPFVSTNQSDVYTVNVPFAFYIGVFQVTQRQYEYMTGQRPSFHKNDGCYQKRPVECVTYDMIRGKSKGAMYPQTYEVDHESVMGVLRQKTGLKGFDLPTEDMWEYACLAGVHAQYNSGVDDPGSMPDLGRYLPSDADSTINQNADVTSGTAEVGKSKANAWGLYDFHGNLYEWCLDMAANGEVPYPVGPLCLGPKRVVKGGSWLDLPELCWASIKYGRCSSIGDNVCGFRLTFR